MSKIHWENWLTKIPLPRDMGITQIQHNSPDLVVFLSGLDDEGSRANVELFFKLPTAYCFTNESNRTRTWNMSILPKPLGPIRFTNRSPFIDWIIAEDGDVHFYSTNLEPSTWDVSKLKHFIVGNDSVLEILTQYEPEIKHSTKDFAGVNL